MKNRGRELDKMDQTVAFVVFSVVPVLKTLSNKTMELGSFPVSFSCHRNFPSGCYCCCSSPSFSLSSSFSSSSAIGSTIRESHDHGILATQISKCYFPYFFFLFRDLFFQQRSKKRKWMSLSHERFREQVSVSPMQSNRHMRWLNISRKYFCIILERHL